MCSRGPLSVGVIELVLSALNAQTASGAGTTALRCAGGRLVQLDGFAAAVNVALIGSMVRPILALTR